MPIIYDVPGTYHFDGAVAYDRLGSSWRTAAGLRSVSVIDGTTGLLPTGLVQDGLAVTFLTADVNSRYSFTCDVPGVVVDFGAGAQMLTANEVPMLAIAAGGATNTAIDARMKWAPATAYALNQQVLSPNNDVVKANVAHTSAAAYATDVAKWDLSGTLTGKVDKGDLVFNVQDYGAVGDGTTDDSAAMTACINEARANNGTVYLSTGKTYILAATYGAFDITGTTVLGYGATVKIKSGTTPQTLFTSSGACQVLGVTFDLNKANTTDPGSETLGAAVYVYGATGWSGTATLRDVTVKNGWQVGIRVGVSLTGVTDPSTAPASRSVIDGCTVTGCYGGIRLYGVADSTVTNSIVTGSGFDGIFDHLTLRSKVTNCTTSGNGRHGIITEHSYGFSASGNHSFGNTGIGVCVGGSGVDTLDTASCFSLTGNTCRSNTASGLSVDITKTTTAPGASIAGYGTITGNVCSNNTQHGIYLNYLSYTSCTGNTCVANVLAGIAVMGLACAFDGNTLIGNDTGMAFYSNAAGYGSHSYGANAVEANTTNNYSFSTNGADNTPMRFKGAGVPAFAAPPGSIYQRSGGGAGTTLYVKESALTATTWTAK